MFISSCKITKVDYTTYYNIMQMPLLVSQISTSDHPVEVGVADSFYVDRPIPPNCEWPDAELARSVIAYGTVTQYQISPW